MFLSGQMVRPPLVIPKRGQFMNTHTVKNLDGDRVIVEATSNREAANEARQQLGAGVLWVIKMTDTKKRGK